MRRPPYGALSGDPEFDVESASARLERIEHAPLDQDDSDNMWIDLRLACVKVRELESEINTLKSALMEACDVAIQPPNDDAKDEVRDAYMDHIRELRAIADATSIGYKALRATSAKVEGKIDA